MSSKFSSYIISTWYFIIVPASDYSEIYIIILLYNTNKYI